MCTSSVLRCSLPGYGRLDVTSITRSVLMGATVLFFGILLRVASGYVS